MSEDTPTPASRGGLLGASTVMAAGTVVSRLTGVVRAAVIAAVIGLAGPAADTFNVPNVIPNTLYILVAGGVLNSVLVPALVRAMKNDSDGGQAYAQKLFSIVVVILGITTVVAVLLAPLIVRLMVSGQYVSDPELRPFFDNMVMFARFCLPQIFFYGLFVLLGQMLNARGRFGPMMWAPILNNIVAVLVFGAYAVVFGINEGVPFTTTQVILLGVGSTLGIAVQAGCLLPVLRRTGLRLRLRTDWRGSGLRTAARLGGWTVGYVAVNQLAYLFVVRAATAGSADGGAGYIVYANAMLVMMVPHAVITVSLATALLPRMSEHAAAGDLAQVTRNVLDATKTCLTVVMALAALMAGLSVPLISVMFGYGAASGSVGITAATFVALLPGLVGYTIHYLMLRGFYSLQDTRTPFFTQIWIAATIGLVALAVALMRPSITTVLLAVGYSVSYIVGAAVSITRLKDQVPGLSRMEVLSHLGLVTVPALLAGGTAFGVGQLTADPLSIIPSPIDHLLVGVLGTALGLAVFAGVGLALQLPDVQNGLDLARRGLEHLRQRRALRKQPPPETTADQTDRQSPTPLAGSTDRRSGDPEATQLDLDVVGPGPSGRPPIGAVTGPEPWDPYATGEFMLDTTMPGALPPPVAPPSPGPTAAADETPGSDDGDTPSSAIGVPAEPDAPRPTMGDSSAEGTEQVSGTPAASEPRPDPEAPVTATTLEPGVVLANRYRLDTLLSDDSRGQSWLAVDDILRRAVHLSILPASDPRSPAMIDAAKRSSSANDLRFLRVLDLGNDTSENLPGTEEGTNVAYIVREWCAGRSLAELVASEPLPATQALAVTREVAEALAAAHATGRSHGRLDPSMVFVDDEHTVRVAGLELAAALQPEAPGALGAPGDMDGLPTDQPVGTDPAARDAAACGAVLYAALTGCWPLGEGTGLDPAPLIDGKLASPRQVRPGIHRTLNEVADRALGNAARHHAEPLHTPAEVVTALAGASASSRVSQLITPAAEAPVQEQPPPAVPEQNRQSSPETAFVPAPRRAGTARRALGFVVGVVLLVGLALVGLQLLLNALNSSDSDDRGSSGQGEQGATEGAATPEPVDIAEVADYDPSGNGEENPDDVDAATDGDSETSWSTVTYYSPLEDQKDGVGLVLDLGEQTEVAQVDLDLVGDDSDVEIRTTDETDEHPESADEWDTAATVEGAGEEVSQTLDEPVSTRYVLVWFTRLPPADGDFRGGVAEAVVLR